MKLITVEEHFESAAVTAAMRQAVGNAALPTVSPALRQYMRDNLPSLQLCKTPSMNAWHLWLNRALICRCYLMVIHHHRTYRRNKQFHSHN
ncbi:metal-dependent hydrolase, N-terminal domain [Lactiplantibacillus plantarum WCFS1]|uniref:Metal-dependent hydrolase, N-terminal domain n=1 Tax=Lactiplantibacillus plantarum (strain ATCC BAA-793 / NCIMB 8826 / WCFS1) TaxID=220668 RepID=F9UUA6_LACPL|nr:metal-dependent hydrolase, N-terminal domain [Lactiplantibacillus plantarum WCFS1]